MAYQVRYTDTTKTPITVEDNTIDESTTLQFPGRNVTGYGQIIAENFLHSLENFASITPPLRATTGQLWYDNNESIKQLKVWDGTEWVAAGGLKKGASQPSVNNSIQGDLWVNTDTQQLYLFTGSAWILIGPRFSEGSRTGTETETLEDTLGNQQIVVVNYVNGVRLAVFSIAEFTPKVVLSGFSKIYKGTTLNSDYDGFYGTAEKSRKLVVGTVAVDSENFLRSDVITNNFKGINIKSNTGMQIGEDGQIQLAVDGNVGVIYQRTSGSSLDIRVNNNGSQKSVIRVDSNERVGINNIAPQEALDVIGNVVISPKPNDSSVTGTVRITSTTESISETSGALIVSGGVGISGDLYISGDINNTGVLRVSTLTPIQDQVTGANIGASNSAFSNVYSNTVNATTFQGLSGTPAQFIGQVQGSVNGPSNYLTSPTVFNITGDIISNEVEFDGRTGSDPVSVQSASGTGSVATLTFAPLPVPPFRSGEVVVVSGMSPTQYNGTHVVIQGTTTKITFSSSATQPLISPGTISPSGVVGNRKRFITQLADDFVKSKIEIDRIDETLGISDEFLVSKPLIDPITGNVTGVGLRKITTNTLFSYVPKIPIGSIMPYAGLTPPQGWLLCDGSEVSKSKYQKLFEVIRYSYGDPNVDLQGFNSFKLPDLRGRFALGADNMNNSDHYDGSDSRDTIITSTGQVVEHQSPANRVLDESADINYEDNSVVRLGSGNEKVNLTVNNLPQHEHNLQADSGAQFNVYSDQLLGEGTSVKGLGGQDAAGRFLQNSGKIRNYTGQTPVNIMNPYLTINYIIYTGLDV